MITEMSSAEAREAYAAKCRAEVASWSPEKRRAMDQWYARCQAESKAEAEYAKWLHANRYWQGW